MHDESAMGKHRRKTSEIKSQGDYWRVLVRSRKEEKGTASADDRESFFAFLFWQRAYHSEHPLQDTPTNFLDALAKNWLRPRLSAEPARYGIASLANKKAKNEGATHRSTTTRTTNRKEYQL